MRADAHPLAPRRSGRARRGALAKRLSLRAAAVKQRWIVRGAAAFVSGFAVGVLSGVVDFLS